MKLLYFILHGITGCKNEDSECFKDKKLLVKNVDELILYFKNTKN